MYILTIAAATILAFIALVGWLVTVGARRVITRVRPGQASAAGDCAPAAPIRLRIRRRLNWLVSRLGRAGP